MADLQGIFKSVGLTLPAAADRKPLIDDKFNEDKQAAVLGEANRLLSSLAALFLNVTPVIEEVEEKAADGTVTKKTNYRFEKGKVAKVIEQIDELMNLQMNEILHHAD